MNARDLIRDVLAALSDPTGRRRHAGHTRRQLDAIRDYVSLYPVIPDGADLGGDPEAMIFRDLRNLLKETL